MPLYTLCAGSWLMMRVLITSAGVDTAAAHSPDMPEDMACATGPSATPHPSTVCLAVS
eukprot:CAMPEP_0202884576 /NCGR_PEP_ID=MMETSP1391-20130828/41150_1 /ASSEMBLY_ACC=CAM_ASM_000867 /TAXON_ID=1034604 /ORGANISM="Chlamydomonas leiostraca, Strain SAG 11-49" /LENGTH=57 /DNA_ID=CAMNT_0049567791 /DNA_START=382 /DNA_END=555 /DNA_ORIENTATION=+